MSFSKPTSPRPSQAMPLTGDQKFQCPRYGGDISYFSGYLKIRLLSVNAKGSTLIAIRFNRAGQCPLAALITEFQFCFPVTVPSVKTGCPVLLDFEIICGTPSVFCPEGCGLGRGQSKGDF